MPGNVIRKDVVQIGFEVDNDPVKEMQTTIDSLTGEAKKAGEALNAMGEPIRKGTDSADGMKRSFSGAADSMSNLLIAAGGYKVMQLVASAFRETASAATEFESAVTGIYKTVDGTPEQLQGLSDAVRDMALSMPTDTTTIAGVMESAGQLGIATDNVEGFAKTMIDLGNSTNLSADQAASSLAKFANVTGMSVDSYDNLGAAIVDLGNNFATTESDIVDMSSYLSSAATLAGFTETDILALSTAMSSVGINAEAGGSAMAQLITKMQTSVETGGASLEQFASIAGMTSQQFQQAFGVNAVGALQSFIMGLNDVERNGSSASVILQDMGLDGIRLSNTVKALASSGDLLTNTVNTANTAWEQNTALASEAEKRYSTLESKTIMMSNAANDLKIAVGNSLAPAMELGADAATGFMKVLSGAADACPPLTAGIMGMVGTVGTAIGGFTTLAPAVTAVSTAFQAFDKTISFSKIGLIVGGISLAVGAVVGLVTAFSDAEDAVEDYNGTLEECSEEIENTQAAHKKAIEMYGAESAAAKELEGQLDTLNKQYQKGGGAAADYIQRMDKSTEALQKIQKDYNNNISNINSTETAGLVMAAQLETVSEKAIKTNSDLDMMSQYASYLNDTFECDIQVNYDTGELTGFDPNDITSQVEKIAKQNIAQAAVERITNADSIKEYGEAVKNAVEARNELGKMGAKLRQLNSPDFINTDGTDYAKLLKDYHALQVELEGYQSTIKGYETTVKGAFSDMGDADGASRYLNGMKQTYADFQPVINSLSDYKYYMGEAGLAAEETADKTESAVSDLSASIAEAEKAYSEMYEAARDSFEKQFGLFDEAAANMEMTVEKFAEAQQTQLQYWTDYAGNVEYLSQFTAEQMGMSEEAFGHLKDYIGSGTQEAAGFAANLTAQIRENGVESIAEMGNTMSQVYDMQGEASAAVAEWGSGINELNRQAMEQLVDTISATANKAFAEGQNVSNKLADGITAGMRNAISAAQSVANSVQSILSSISVSVPNVSVNSASDVRMYLSGTYATGTMNAAPGLALVGENGPELVNFGGGEVVYTAEETKQIMRQQALFANLSSMRSVDTSLDTTYDTSYMSDERSYISNSNYSPSFVLNYTSNGGGESEVTVKRWIREAMDEVFDDMSAENAPVWEV